MQYVKRTKMMVGVSMLILATLMACSKSETVSSSAPAVEQDDASNYATRCIDGVVYFTATSYGVAIAPTTPVWVRTTGPWHPKEC